jgi:outer membrane protein OmpA-like peptidoglycan-associated protein
MANLSANPQVYEYSVKKLFCFFLFLWICTSQISLKAQSKKAIESYQKGMDALRYGKLNDAFSNFEEALRREPRYADAFFQLGKLYEFNRQFGVAIQQYDNCLQSNPAENIANAAYTNAGFLFLKKGDYQKTIDYLAKISFLANQTLKSREKTRIEKAIASSKFAIEALKTPLAIQPKVLPTTVNKFDSQYFPVLTADRETMIFTGYNSTDNDENLYISTIQNGNWNEPMGLSDNINTAQSEGTASISADGRTLIFTSCQDTRGLGSCDLYISKKMANRWTKPENMGEAINSPSWDSQPSLSADGQTLYFVSDRTGGMGRYDIYVSTLDSLGRWKKAQNIGKNINTPDDEMSPFVHANGSTLFFSGNGYLGMGGYDIYRTDLESGQWTAPRNMGYPLNTHENQVGLFVTSDGTKAYYSVEKGESARTRNAQLVEVELPESVKNSFKRTVYLKGTISDAQSKQNLAANVELVNLKTNEKHTFASDAVTGQYLSVLNEGGEYAVFVSREGYFFKSLSFDFSQKAQDKILDISLEPIKKNSREVLNNLYFDTGKWELKNESLPELEKLHLLLKNNPNLTIEISGHTDDVGRDADNLLLSQKRAKSVAEYLIKNGINILRVKVEGYGKTRPIVQNTSDENRRLNRRIEVKIL